MVWETECGGLHPQYMEVYVDVLQVRLTSVYFVELHRNGERFTVDSEVEMNCRNSLSSNATNKRIVPSVYVVKILILSS